VNTIGLFGGTFNPVHLGHLRTALEVKEELNLDQVVLIPSALPPHKKPDHMALAKDRLEMLHIAVQDNPDFLVSDIELMRQGPSFTIDTVCHFKSLYQDNARLFFIIGSDAFLELNTWKSHIELLKSIPFAVMMRPTSRCRDTAFKPGHFHDFVLQKISPEYARDKTESRYDHPSLSSIYICNVTPLDISSTKIRQLIHNHKSVKYLIPEQVEKFIQTKGLYT
jgi:nicotinate-nucleotide adenylyltransferase